ncbi:MAG: T9SS type A sorting domain-containing protein [Chitinispirillaceae bacterium]|nr:T9SS type A sorting domain-containing protein [Chitinispirillaceae bacterium]
MKNSVQKTCISLLIAGAFLYQVPSSSATYNLVVDGSKKQGHLPHFWSECVGTGTMIYCLKPEWQVAAKIGAEEAGFKRVRGHGILIGWNGTDNTGIMTLNGGAATYNWTNLDKVVDYLLSINLQPSIELSFMPKALQSNGVTSKPNDWNAWRDLIQEMVLHCIDRWGEEEVLSWYWEVWNEYDYSGFWNGTEQDYYMLYQKAAEGAKSANSKIIIGGPVTTGPHNLQKFVDYCKTNNVPYDLLANHYYGEAPGTSTDPVRIRDENRTRSDVIRLSGKKVYSLNTEFNSTYTGQGGNTDPNVISMDSHKNAPFVVKCVKLIIDDFLTGQYTFPDMLSYWAISDVFDESGTNKGSWVEMNNYRPFGAVFGLINYQGIRKATFNAFKMLHMMGDTLLSVTGGSNDTDGADAFATVNADTSKVAVIVYNFYKDLNGTGGENSVNLTVQNLPFPHGNVKVARYLVDETHSNAYGVWLEKGKPQANGNGWDAVVNAQQLYEIDAEPAEFEYDGTAFTTSMTLGRYAVYLLVLEKDLSSAAVNPEIRRTGDDVIERKGNLITLRNLPDNRQVSLVVYDARGRVLSRYEQAPHTIDLSRNNSPGLYLIGIETAGINIVKKCHVW